MDTKISSELLASILGTIAGRSIEVVKAPDEDSDDEVRISEDVWIQVGGYYAIVFHKVNGRHVSRDVKNLYEVIEALRELVPESLVPNRPLLQF